MLKYAQPKLLRVQSDKHLSIRDHVSKFHLSSGLVCERFSLLSALHQNIAAHLIMQHAHSFFILPLLCLHMLCLRSGSDLPHAIPVLRAARRAAIPRQHRC